MSDRPFWLELDDSEVARAEVHGDSLVLRLAAAHVRHPLSHEHGHVRHVELWCLQARWEGMLTEALGRIRVAQAESDSSPLSLQVPGCKDRPVTLSLEFGFGSTLVVHAEAVETRFSGPPEFHESLAC